MWLFLTDAFFSIVEHRDDPTKLLVRARFKGDIERHFSGVKVQTTPRADYRYRAVVKRNVVKEKVRELVMFIDYDNFKNQVPPGHKLRKRAYHDVWATMHAAQLQEAGNGH